MLRYTSYLILFILLNALSLNIFARQIQLESTIYILDIAWSPSGTQLAVVGGDPGIIENSINISAHGYVSVVNSVTNQTIFMTEPTSVFTSVTWSPDGKLLALGSFDGTIWIIDASTGESITNLFGHQSTVTDVKWSTDGRYLVSTGNWDQLVLTWDMINYKAIRHIYFNAHTNTISITPDNLSLAIGTESGLFIIPINGESETSVGLDSLVLREWVKQLAYSPDGNYLAIGTIAHISLITGLRDKAKVIIINLKDNKVEAEFQSDFGSISGLAWDLDNQSLAVLNQDDSLTIWNKNSGIIIDTYPVYGMDRYQQGGVAYSLYGGRLAFGNAVNPALNYELEGGNFLSEGAIGVVVPAPSLNKLNAIAAMCVRDSIQRTEAVSALTSTLITTLEALPNFVAQIEALPDGAIPTACKADVLAVAQALTVQP